MGILHWEGLSESKLYSSLRLPGRLTAGKIRGSEAHQCQKRPPGGLPSAPQSFHAPYDLCPGC